ncbi:MAG TPA: nitronate monooxygenase [Caulobacteraceae bacterium]|nr:nitronate monooxygenase [Caulobacteraceae bacterium]
MPFQSALIRRLGMHTPVVQAPMAGGSDSVELAAAVSNAGGLGSFGCAYLSGEQIIQAGRAIRGLTERPFCLNLFTPWDDPGAPDPAAALAAMAPLFAELGLPAPSAPAPQPVRFDEQFEAVLESGAAVFSFTFGLPPAGVVEAAHARGVEVVGTATTVEEAVKVGQIGCDAVIAQGAEAGGHRGTFIRTVEESLVGTMALVPQVCDAVAIPVIAAGGIMDGRGLAAALALGAQAVQMGTVFLTADEAGANSAYRLQLMRAHEDETALTRAFSGRHARGIANRVFREVADEAILPFPLQNALTRPLRTEAARQGRSEFLSMWAGQGLRMAKTGRAADLVAEITAQAESVLRSIG